MRFWIFLFVFGVIHSSVSASVLSVPSTSFPNLAAAVQAAAAGDIISVAAGSFTATQGNCDLIIEKSISFIGAGSSQTILDCGLQSRAFAVFGSNVVITGIQIKNGAANLPSDAIAPSLRRSISSNPELIRSVPRDPQETTRSKGPPEPQIHSDNERPSLRAHAHLRAVSATAGGRNESLGGCVLSTQGSTLILSDVTFTGCQALLGSGLASVASTLNVTSSTFTRNGVQVATTDSAIGGGALFSSASTVFIKTSTFTSNTLISSTATAVANGGAVSAVSGGTINVEDTAFTGNFIQTNSAAEGAVCQGGGMSVSGLTSASFLRCTFATNQIVTGSTSVTTQPFGGGLAVDTTLSLSLSSSTFRGNFLRSDSADPANPSGGGLVALSVRNVTIASSIFSGNSILMRADGQAAGGATYMKRIGTSVITDSVFSDQTLRGEGDGRTRAGALFFTSALDAVVVTNTQITNNSNWGAADGNAYEHYGAGIYIDASTATFAFTNVNIDENTIGVTNDGTVGLASGVVAIVRCSGLISFTGCSLSRNTLVPRFGSDGSGAALIAFSTPITMVNCQINDNKVTYYGSGTAGGIGLYLSGVQATFSRCSFQRNSVVTSLSSACVAANAYVPPPLTNDTVHCKPLTGVNNLCGTVNDGSWGEYSANTVCTWVLNPSSSVAASGGAYNLSFTQLEVEKEAGCNWDSVSIFDGPTSFSRMIGRYCGDSINDWACGGGACPPISQILTTSAAVTVTFISDYSGTVGGFSMNWNFIAQSGTTGTTPYGGDDLPPSQSGFPTTSNDASSRGGGIFVNARSVVTIIDSTFRGNSISHPAVAAGGGVYVAATSILSVFSSVFDGNKVSSRRAAGGGLGVASGSSVSIDGTQISGNVAEGVGLCLVGVTGATNCPIAWAGGVGLFTATSGLVSTNITNSQISGNEARCPGAWCISIGGGLVTANSVLSLSSTSISKNLATFGAGIAAIESPKMSVVGGSCLDNTCFCASGRAGCLWAVGGCLYADSGTVSISAMTFANNFVSSVGAGGAVFTSGTVTFSMSSSTLTQNYAREGAGIWMGGHALLNVTGTTISNNTAFVGGAIAIAQDVTAYLKSTVVSNNTANRASAIWAFSESGKAAVTFDNLTVISGVGSMSTALGKLSGLAGGATWKCTQPGTIMKQEVSEGYYSLDCFACSPGTYSLGNGESNSVTPASLSVQCRSCPYGARCTGSSPLGDGLESIPAFYGVPSDENLGEVVFYNCPAGFCCPFGSVSCPYQTCEGNRIGILCGYCPDDRGLRLFTKSCGLNSSCNDAGWAGAVASLGAIAMALWLTATTGNYSDGLLSVLLFFYQVSPLVKSSEWQYVWSTIISVIQSVFSFSPTGDSNSAGICIKKSMLPAEKIVIKVLFQAMVLGAIVVVFAAHLFINKILKIRYMIDKYPVNRLRYLMVATRFITIAYTTIILTPLELVQCIYINNTSVWWWDTRTECYSGWQIVAWAVFVVLAPLPMGLIFAMRKWHHQKADGVQLAEWKLEAMRVVGNGFKDKYCYWLGISLYRRLLLVLAYTMIVDTTWKSVAVTALCALYLMTHLFIEPFEKLRAHMAETISLILLCFLAATTSPQLAHRQFGSLIDIKRAPSLEWIQFIILLIPIFTFVSFSAFKFHKTLRDRKNDKNKDPTALEVDDSFYMAVKSNSNSVAPTPHAPTPFPPPLPPPAELPPLPDFELHQMLPRGDVVWRHEVSSVDPIDQTSTRDHHLPSPSLYSAPIAPLNRSPFQLNYIERSISLTSPTNMAALHLDYDDSRIHEILAEDDFRMDGEFL